MKKKIINLALGIISLLLFCIVSMHIKNNKTNIIVYVGISFYKILTTISIVLVLLAVIWIIFWLIRCIMENIHSKRNKEQSQKDKSQIVFYSINQELDTAQIDKDLNGEIEYAMYKNNKIILEYASSVRDDINKMCSQSQKFDSYINKGQNNDPLLASVSSTLQDAVNKAYKKASINVINRLNFLKNPQSDTGYDYDNQDLKAIKEDVDEFNATMKSCISLSKKAINFSIESKHQDVLDNEIERQALEQVVEQLSSSNMSISRSLSDISLKL